LPWFAALICVAGFVGDVQKGQLPPAEVQAFLAALMAGGTGLGAWLGRHVFRSMHRTPLAAAEVEAFPAAAYDEVERAYLGLVLDTIRQTVPPDGEPEVRAALRTVGEAIDRLPAVPLVAGASDALRTQADALAAQAQAESDEVARDSFLRQAESLRRRADIVHRSAQLVRRTIIVRQEILDQIETLRAGLAACNAGAGDVSDLSELAESVRRVAAEADAIAAAREELDAATLPPNLADPAIMPVAETASLQHVGRR